MKKPEFLPTTSPDSIDEEPEPSPIPIEKVDELLLLIQGLWSQHGQAKAERTDVTHLNLQISDAYDQLEAICGSLDDGTVAEYIIQARPWVEFELWFACNHLEKVVKLKHN